MARIDELQQYLTANRASKGTREYDAANAEYNALADQEEAARGGSKDQILERAAPGPQMMKDPGGLAATAARGAGSIVLGVPDIATHIGNAATRMAEKYGIPLGAGVMKPGQDPLGRGMTQPGQQAPVPSDLLNKYMGVPETPPGLGRALGEGALGALGGNISGIVRGALKESPALVEAARRLAGRVTSQAVAPTIVSHYGSELGSKYGESLGFDKETAALIGGLLGGTSSAVPGIVQNARHNYYANNANPNAQNIVSDARALMAGNDLAAQPAGTYGPPAPRPINELPLNAGLLGNEKIIAREQALGRVPGSTGEFIESRRKAPIDLINEAMDRIEEQRGANRPTPDIAGVGQGVKDIFSDRAVSLREQHALEQAGLRDRMGGDDTIVNLERIFESAQPHLDQNTTQLTPSARDALAYRLNELRRTQQLDPDTRNPLEPPQARLGPFANWRSELGRAIDNAETGGQVAAAPHLYGPATDAYRNTAAYSGVPPADFEAIMGANRDTMRPPDPTIPGDRGGPFEQHMDIANKEPGAAYSWLEGGNKNPDRLQLLADANHPDFGSVMANHLRLMRQQTVGTPSSRGPVQFSQAVSEPRMSPESLQTIAGPHTSEVQSAANLADASVYPTNQMRLGRAAGSSGDVAGGTVSNATIGYLLGKAAETQLGVPYGAEAGAALGAKSRIPFARWEAGALEGPTAMNALAGGAAPRVMTMPELIASFNAVASQQPTQQLPPITVEAP
jgi:hypothetical protein